MIAALILAAVVSSPPPLNPALENVLDSIRPGTGAAALQAADAYVGAHPSDADGFAVRCSARTQLWEDGENAQGQKALDDCRAALKLAPSDGFAHYAFADLLYDAEQFKDSLAQYTQAIQLGVTNRGIYWKRCDAYRRVGDLDDALTDCNAQVAQGGSFFAYYTRGHLFVARKEYAKGISDLTAALSIKSSDIDSFYWRGLAYLQSGDAANAQADFTRCIELGDTSGDTYYHRALARVTLKENAGAKSDLETALRIYRAGHADVEANAVEELLAKLPPL